jgi:hypothetical protein
MTTGTIGQGPPMTVPGTTTQVIFNDAGVLVGDTGFTYNKATDLPTFAGLAGTGTRFVGASAAGALVAGAALATPAMDFITATAISGSSSSTNGCFTSAYRNYVLLWNLDVVNTVNVGIFLRLRAEGVDNTTALYQ